MCINTYVHYTLKKKKESWASRFVLQFIWLSGRHFKWPRYGLFDNLSSVGPFFQFPQVSPVGFETWCNFPGTELGLERGNNLVSFPGLFYWSRSLISYVAIDCIVHYTRKEDNSLKYSHQGNNPVHFQPTTLKSWKLTSSFLIDCLENSKYCFPYKEKEAWNSINMNSVSQIKMSIINKYLKTNSADFDIGWWEKKWPRVHLSKDF